MSREAISFFQHIFHDTLVFGWIAALALAVIAIWIRRTRVAIAMSCVAGIWFLFASIPDIYYAYRYQHAASNIRSIKVGMSREDVIDRLGTPDFEATRFETPRSTNASGRQTTWQYIRHHGPIVFHQGFPFVKLRFWSMAQQIDHSFRVPTITLVFDGNGDLLTVEVARLAAEGEFDAR